MESTYLVRGPDGKDYGPVALDPLLGWIREGRVNSSQLIQRNDSQEWLRADQIAELQGSFAPVNPPQLKPVSRTVDPADAAHVSSGASWFFWIAGLSIINSIISFTGSSFGFALGLGITQIIDALGGEAQTAGRSLFLLVSIFVSSIFILLGILGKKGHTWAFVLGILCFGLDTLLCLIASAWLSLALHALAIFYLFRGMQSCRRLNKANA